MNEIKRKVERFLCRLLGEQLPGQTFVPSKGGNDAGDTGYLAVPYTVIEASGAEKMLQDEPTWLIAATATYVTHIDDTSAPEHSRNARAIYDVLEQIPTGYDQAQSLVVHGTDITGTDEISDAERQSHGDVITLTVAVTG